MQKSSHRHGLGLVLGTVALLAVALTVPLVFAQTKVEPAEPLELINFLPEPDRILVQRDAGFPQLGDTRLTMVLSAAAVDELRKVTGRSDFAVIGSRDAQLILRDDGQGGDPVAGDGQFSTIVTLPSGLPATRSCLPR